MKLIEAVMGLDVGKVRDYSALCLIERWQKYHEYPREHIEDGDPIYHLKFAERLPLDTDYTIQKQFCKMAYDQAVSDYDMKTIKGVKVKFVLDATGPGLPILDEFRKVIKPVQGIYFTSGSEVNQDGYKYYVPKKDLVTNLQIIIQSKRIQFASTIPGLKTLQDELLTFSYKIKDSGHATFEHWRERDHDDLVLSVACALWYSELGFKRLTGAQMAMGAQVRRML